MNQVSCATNFKSKIMLIVLLTIISRQTQQQYKYNPINAKIIYPITLQHELIYINRWGWQQNTEIKQEKNLRKKQEKYLPQPLIRIPFLNNKNSHNIFSKMTPQIVLAPRNQQKRINVPQFCSYKKQTLVKPQELAYSGKDQSRYILASTNYGFNMYVDSKDYTVSNSIRFQGTWQPQYINLIGHIIKQGDYVLNLGSQSGLQALVMGKIIGPKGRLFVFQPYSFSYNLVKRNIQINNLTNITQLYNFGASDQKTKAVIKVDYQNTGGSQISQKSPQMSIQRAIQINKLLGYGQSQSVQLNLVDNLLPQNIKLDFALIDVQQMQVKALKGMKKIIERSQNLIIMTQWQYNINLKKNREQTLQLLKWLGQKGYKAYKYQGGDVISCNIGDFYQFKNIQDLILQPFTSDIFFFPSTQELP